METIKSSMHPSGIVEIKFCNVDRIFYIYLNSEAIHTQKTEPSLHDIEEAARSNEWVRIIASVKKGNRERCSLRMYYHFLEVLPPMNFEFQNMSFYNSEPVTTINEVQVHYFLELEDNFRFISLKPLPSKKV